MSVVACSIRAARFDKGMMPCSIRVPHTTGAFMACSIRVLPCNKIWKLLSAMGLQLPANEPTMIRSIRVLASNKIWKLLSAEGLQLKAGDPTKISLGMCTGFAVSQPLCLFTHAGACAGCTGAWWRAASELHRSTGA
eukprot:jgi/Chrzof1/13459/UNPLg00542.t1